MNEINEQTLRKVMGLIDSDPIPESLKEKVNRVELMSARADQYQIPASMLASLVVAYDDAGLVIKTIKKGDAVLIDRGDGKPTEEGTVVGKKNKNGCFQVAIPGDEKAEREIDANFLTLLPKAEILEAAIAN